MRWGPMVERWCEYGGSESQLWGKVYFLVLIASPGTPARKRFVGYWRANEKMTVLSERLQEARYRLSYDRPYLSTILYALVGVEKPGLGTMGVDNSLRLYFDPSWVDAIAPLTLGGVLYHEVGHILRSHHERAEALGLAHDPVDGFVWNLAADAEINDDLLAEQVKLPSGCVTPSVLGKKDGLTAEEYLEAAGRSVKVLLTVPSPGNGACGSCSGHAQPWEDGDPQPGDGSLSVAEVELVKRQVAKDVKEAMSKEAGNVPGWLQRFADGLLNPKVNWRHELAASVRRSLAEAAGLVNYSYNRVSRHSPADVILPGWRRPVPNVVVELDTSGSMGKEELTEALAEIKGILETCGVGLHVLVTDHHVHSAKKVFSVKQIAMVGGGGTDMRLGIDAALKLHPRPDIIVVVTDGYTPWPDVPVAAKVIACLVGTQPFPEVPKWIKKIRVAD